MRLRMQCTASAFAELRSRLEAIRFGTENTAAIVVTADYEPEAERYGGPDGLEIAHDVFMHDSIAALELVPAVLRDPVIAAASAWGFLSSLGLTDGEVDVLYSRRFARIANEMSITERELAQSADKQVPSFTKRWPTALSATRALTAGRPHTAALAAAGDRLRAASEQGLLHRTLIDIAVDLQHMHFNRLGVSSRSEASLVIMSCRAICNSPSRGRG